MEQEKTFVVCPFSMASANSKPCDPCCELYSESGDCLLTSALRTVAGLSPIPEEPSTYEEKWV